ncbi:hypothetical protein OIE82_27205 [Streptomyces althioticus]|uniref:Uncharacterized protein n=1 Tax=Streptomyces althioticus TaxID=83380 RepID=A0ABZ1YDA3_9ACTN
MVDYEKYGIALAEDEVEQFIDASTIVFIGLLTGLEEEPAEKLIPVAEGLVSSYLVVQFGVPKSQASALAKDFLAEALEGLA